MVARGRRITQRTSDGEICIGAFEDDVDVWMVIGRPNVMKLLISVYQELAIHTIFKIFTRRSLYNTLLRIGSPVFSRIPDTYETKPNSSIHPEENDKGISFIMTRQTCLILSLVVIIAVVWGLPQQPKSRRPIPEFKVCFVNSALAFARKLHGALAQCV